MSNPTPTAAEIAEFVACYWICKRFLDAQPYQPAPVAAKATRAAIHRQGLPIPGRSAKR